MRAHVTFVRYAAVTVIVGAAMASFAPADADPGCTPAACPSTDVDFANQLQTYGIYGPRDYNAWIAKLTCERLNEGVDADAFASQRFVLAGLPRHSTDVQAWQFLGTTITTYCPDQAPALERVSARHT